MDWLETITNRIRNLCRVVRHGEDSAIAAAVKADAPISVKWIKMLPWRRETAPKDEPKDEDEPKGEDEPKEDEPKSEDEPKGEDEPKREEIYKCRLNNELNNAWRVKVGEDLDGGAEEPTMKLSWVPDLDVVTAKWFDGYEHVFEGPEATEFLALFRDSRAKHSALWQDTHAKTKHTLEIKQRIDRQLLLSLYEQTRQILQVRMDRFGLVPGEPQKQLQPDDPTLKIAVSFMTKLAEKYRDDELDVKELKTMRDEELKKIPLQPKVAPPQAVLEAATPIMTAALVSEPGICFDFLFRKSDIFNVINLFSKNRILRYRRNNNGVLGRPWTKSMVLMSFRQH